MRITEIYNCMNNNIKIGRLLVIKEVEPTKNARRFLCKCDCGNEIIIRSCNLGTCTFSCGCYRKENTKYLSYKHGLSNTRLHSIWRGMKERCNNKNSTAYENYGARGIKLCNSWNDSFENFYEWAIHSGYQEDLSIDRVNVNGNYEPSNCRWANNKTQGSNKRNNNYLYHDGKLLTITEWSRITGINRRTISDRINKFHWDVDKALTEEPVYGRRRN